MPIDPLKKHERHSLNVVSGRVTKCPEVEIEQHDVCVFNFFDSCAGHQVVVVSSGAVGAGCLRLGLNSKPASLAKRQALAAVGQVHLMRYYADAFSAYGLVSS